MAEYQLMAPVEPCSVIRTSDDVCIPPDPANRDYAEFTSWKEAGGVPDPYVPPPVAPPTPTNEQILLYDHENRIRAQEGQPPLTLEDFLTKLKV